MSSQSFRVSVDYHQFYLWDVGAGRLAPEEYSGEDILNRVKVDRGVIVVQPVRNDEVPVELVVAEADPGVDLEQWDHVVEVELEASTGELEVHECLGGAVTSVQVAPGRYRVRVLFAGLASVSDDGFEGDDGYTLQIWPGTGPALQVVKRWSPDDGPAG